MNKLDEYFETITKQIIGITDANRTSPLMDRFKTRGEVFLEVKNLVASIYDAGRSDENSEVDSFPDPERN